MDEVRLDRSINSETGTSEWGRLIGPRNRANEIPLARTNANCRRRKLRYRSDGQRDRRGSRVSQSGVSVEEVLGIILEDVFGFCRRTGVNPIIVARGDHYQNL